MLRQDFMRDCGLTVAVLARRLGVSRQTVNDILREKRSITPDMAMRLSRLFGNSPEFWIGVQSALDLWLAQKKGKRALSRTEPLNAA
jgi:addiction module HigA family antidote